MEKYINQFVVDVTGSEMQEVIEKTLAEMQSGLDSADSTSSLAMIPSYTDISSGHESGLKLAIDFGGTNLRCVLYKMENRQIEEVEKREKKIDQKIKVSSGKDIFSFVADEIIAFLEEPKVKALLGENKEIVQAGYTFSFAVTQTSISSGTFLRWSKGFTDVDDVKGLDVVNLLSSILTEKGYGHVKIVALCNDTVGTLCAASLIHGDALIGVIQGTGTNACYREKTSNIKKIKNEANLPEYMIINMEMGSLNVFPSAPEDDAVHRITRIHGGQKFEKMSSGKYLPFVVRVALRRCIENGWVLYGLSGDHTNWDQFEQLSARDIEIIQFDASPDLHEARNLILKYSAVGGLASAPPSETADSSSSSSSDTPAAAEWTPNPDDLKKITDQDVRLIQALFTSIVNRSADITAVAISSIVIHIITKVESVPSITVAVDGSIYLKHVGYKEEMHRALDLCLAKQAFLRRIAVPRVVCVPQRDGSGAGAAVIAAVQANFAAAAAGAK